jgi:hypothetical protein
MEGATEVLLQADLVLAENVISQHERITAMSAHAEEADFVLLALQAPVAWRFTLRCPRCVTQPTWNAWVALRCTWPRSRRRHPAHALPEEVNGYFAEMERIAVELEQQRPRRPDIWRPSASRSDPTQPSGDHPDCGHVLQAEQFEAASALMRVSVNS